MSESEGSLGVLFSLYESAGHYYFKSYFALTNSFKPKLKHIVCFKDFINSTNAKVDRKVLKLNFQGNTQDNWGNKLK